MPVIMGIKGLEVMCALSHFKLALSRPHGANYSPIELPYVQSGKESG